MTAQACSVRKTNGQTSTQMNWSDMQKISRDLPNNGYAIIVDGCVKIEFATKEGVENGARDLKRRFPMLQVKIYDAQAKADHEINVF